LVGMSLGFFVGALIALIHSKLGRVKRRLAQAS
jgi:hypothetical protein